MNTLDFSRIIREFVVAIVIVFAFGLLLHAFGAPNFVTPNMLRRNGLTDEQYELLWKQGKNPKIDIAAARAWIYKASRYQNVTNWMDVLGTTNNFAKLSYKLQDENFVLEETNKAVKAECAHLAQSNSVLEVELEYSKEYEKQVKEIQKAAKKDGKNLEKLRNDLEKYRDKAETEDFKTLCQMLLDLLPVPNEGK